jgi:hypothetical protein
MKEEWAEVVARRGVAGKPLDVDATGRPGNLAGLALSGGGIRSATFCLGLLQGLDAKGLLEHFDYLSTVSGGGFVGGWWSAWLARGDTGRFPPPERITPEQEQHEYKEMSGQVATGAREHESEGSVHAGRDPVHHLRLFANYLTPRKGAFSADTWLAAAVLSRNLVLTWLILVPLLIAIVWMGQLYFVVHPASRQHFHAELFPTQPAALEDAEKMATGECLCSKATETAALRPGCVLECRARAALTLLGPLLILMGLMVVVWMIWSRDRWTPADAFLVVASQAAAAGLILVAVKLVLGSGSSAPIKPWHASYAVVSGVALLLLLYALRRPRIQADVLDRRFLMQLRRNQIVRVYSALLLVTTLVAGALALAGFGHDLVDYVFFSARPQGALGMLVARVGGWGTVLLTLAGMIYTAVNSAPTGGGETSRAGPSPKREIILSLTPPLVVTVLGLLAAWTGHWLLQEMLEDPVTIRYLTIASAIGVVLVLCLAIYEFHPPRQWQSVLLALLAIAFVVAAAFAIHYYSLVKETVIHRHWTLGLMAAAGGLLLFRALVIDDWKASPEVRDFRVRFLRPERGRTARALGFLGLAVAAISGLMFWLLLRILPWPSSFDEPTALGGLAGFIICVAVSVFELVWGRGGNPRAIGLLAGAYAVLAAFALIGFWPEWKSLHAVVGLIGGVLAWVIAFGWLADPNALSLHTFYQTRLVRAYLGASNRERAGKEIGESALGDDVRLTDLKNCAKGAPYHLINTTLNLVGARDLATALRSSAYFTLSKRFCGCPRTGYRPTELYMCGTLSLGTAIAISGAAASPNMGSRSPTAAGAMLMTLLNVRLGYWAPTPDQPYWKMPQARLWPVYMVEELLSQTNDLGSYCYLTDGGHFDNTGLYSLVERGCRFIVLADCGADPYLSFADLGEAIRRCRIDFGTQIQLDLSSLTQESPTVHFARGTIRYSPKHAASLGWGEEEKKDGELVLVKPILARDATVDVQNYQRQNNAFPQQSTIDQFFDEAQFESYRALGELSARRASVAIGQMMGADVPVGGDAPAGPIAPDLG